MQKNSRVFDINLQIMKKFNKIIKNNNFKVLIMLNKKINRD